jgi:MFS family permease
MFALFLIGWDLAFLWASVSDRFGRATTLAATTLVYALFTGAAALAPSIWLLASFRFLAGIGIGGEWAMAGTYVAEAWPEDRREMSAGYLQTGYRLRPRPGAPRSQSSLKDVPRLSRSHDFHARHLGCPVRPSRRRTL